MKQIIVDYMWRKSWIIATALVVDIFFVRLCGPDNAPMVFAAFLPALFVGPVLLSYDLQYNVTRALIALPVTAKEIGRAWWVSTVGLPALLLLAVTTLSAIVPLVGGHTELLFLNCLMQAVALGGMFFLLSFMPAGYQGSWQEKVRGGFFGALWGFSCGGGFLLFMNFSWSHRLQAGIFLGIGAALTIAGWFRAESMVLHRGSFRQGTQIARAKSRQYHAPAGFGGLPFLWQSLLVRLGLCSLFFVAFIVAASVLLTIMEGKPMQQPLGSFEHWTPLFMWSLFWVYLTLMPPIMAHVRALRTLPISTTVLSATLVLFPTILFLILEVAYAAVGAGRLVVGNCMAAAGALAVVLPLMIWLGLTRGMYMLTVGLIMASIILTDVFDKASVSPFSAILVLVLAAALAWEITRLLLRASSKAYRARPILTSNWGGVRWS